MTSTTFFHSFTEKCYEITSRLYFNLAHFQTNPRRYYREQNVSYKTADLTDTTNVLRRRRYFLSNKCIEESLQVHVKAELCVSKATPKDTHLTFPQIVSDSRNLCLIPPLISFLFSKRWSMQRKSHNFAVLFCSFKFHGCAKIAAALWKFAK